MRPLPFISLAALGLLYSCSSPAPTAPNGFLTGTWGSASPPGYFELILQSSGGTVTGTAVSACCNTEMIVTKGTVTGTYGGGGFSLQLRFPTAPRGWTGERSIWTGHLGTSPYGTDELRGPLQETTPGDSLLGTMLLTRTTDAP